MHQVASLLGFCGSRGIRYLGPRLSRTATRSAGVPFRHPVMLGVLFWFIRKWRRRLRLWTRCAHGRFGFSRHGVFRSDEGL